MANNASRVDTLELLNFIICYRKLIIKIRNVYE